MNIGLISGFGWGQITTSIHTTASHLRNLGYEVYIFFECSEFSEGLGIDSDLFSNSGFHLINISSNVSSQNKKRSFKWKNIEVIDVNFASLILDLGIFFDVLVGFDPKGLVRCSLVNSFQKCKIIYFSLEIHDESHRLKTYELYHCKYADIIITQDKFRAQILSKLNNYPFERIFHVYNTTIGKPIPQGSTFLRDTLNISHEKAILLTPGSIMRSHGLHELLHLASDCENKIALVFHGWIPYRNDQTLLDNVRRRYPDVVYHAKDLYSHEEKYKVHSSADVGFIFYEPRDINFKYAAWASGKFFDFMRCGIPVLCKNILNAESLILDNKVGLLYSNPEEIIPKVLQLSKKKIYFTNNCHEAFEKYSFCKSFNLAWKSLNLRT